MTQRLPFRFKHLPGAALLLAGLALPRLTAAQAPRWQRLVEVQPMGYPYPFVAEGIVASLDGDAIVVGTYPPSGHNPPVPVTAYDAPIARIAPDGQVRWTLLTPAYTDSTWSYTIDPSLIAVTSAGHVAVGGHFSNGPAILGTDTLRGTTDGYFIGELDGQTGQWRWARALDVTPTKLATDPSTSGFLLSVMLDGNHNLGGTVPDPTATFGILRVQNSQWQWLGGLRGAGRIAQLSGTPQGDVVVSGAIASQPFDSAGTVQFGTLTLQRRNHARNTYLARLAAGGAWLWATLIEGSSADIWGGVQIASELVATDGSGNVFMAGSFTDTLQVGAFRLVSTGVKAGFLARLNAAGVAQAAELLATDTVGYNTRTGAYVEVKGLQIDAQGSVILGGHFGGRLHLGNQLLPSVAQQVLPQGYLLPADLFVARRTTAGWSWATTINSPLHKEMGALHLTPAGQVVVAAMGLAGPLALGQDTTHLTRRGTFVTWLGERPLTGLSDAATSSTSLALWPNPAATVAHLTLPSPANASTAVTLTDALGRTVRTDALPAGTTRLDLPLRGLPAGLYLVRAGQHTARLVVRGE